MPDRTNNVAAYHRKLSQHLSKALHSHPNVLDGQRLTDVRPGSSKTQSSNSLSKVSSAESSGPQNPQTGPAATSSRSTDTTTLPTPPDVARHEEHSRAWEGFGPHTFSLPSSFNLSLDHRRRCAHDDQDAAKEDSRVKGLGIDLAMSAQQQIALKMGLMVDPLVSAPIRQLSKPLDVRMLMPMASRESLKSAEETTGVSVNVASAATSLHHDEHATPQPRRRSAESSSKPTTKMRRDMVESLPLRDVNDADDKEEEYEARRQVRLQRKKAELIAKINHWRQGVQVINLEVSPPCVCVLQG